MTITISFHEVQAHFPGLFAQVLDGEDVIIAEGNKELMRVVPGKDASPVQSRIKQHEPGEQTLTEALAGVIGTVRLDNAPSAREVKQVFGAIVEEKLGRPQF
jgi:antitoxin (DNA-binding transcriptional repressor) of toxin-antitoxin stability system